MMELDWLDRQTIDAIHEEQIAEHGGAAGLRDAGLLESALARPRNLFLYGQNDLAAIAAAYAFGIVRNHPYIDGNKRTAFLAAYVFLEMNGMTFDATPEEVVVMTLGLASGEVEEADYANFLRMNATAV